MKALLCHLILLCSLAGHASSAESSHRQAAMALLDISGGKSTITTGFEMMMGTMESMWKQQGVPDHVVPVLRDVLRSWVAEDIKWEEIEPLMLDLYMREFTEPELRELTAFYRTTTGQKALAKLPVLTAEGAKIGESYARTKQQALERRIQEAMATLQAAPKSTP